MNKIEVLNKIFTNKLIAVIRNDSYDKALNIAYSCIEAGITLIEIAFTCSYPDKLIYELSKKNIDNIIIGAGTVLDTESARVALLNGAKFIVAPSFNRDVAKLCNRYSTPYIPGCMTVNEIVKSLEYGSDIIKLFPANSFDYDFIHNIRGPLPQVNIMITGGVNIGNVKKWLDSKACSVCIGSELNKTDNIFELVKSYLEIINSY